MLSRRFDVKFVSTVSPTTFAAFSTILGKGNLFIFYPEGILPGYRFFYYQKLKSSSAPRNHRYSVLPSSIDLTEGTSIPKFDCQTCVPFQLKKKPFWSNQEHAPRHLFALCSFLPSNGRQFHPWWVTFFQQETIALVVAVASGSWWQFRWSIHLFGPRHIQ